MCRTKTNERMREWFRRLEKRETKITSAGMHHVPAERSGQGAPGLTAHFALRVGSLRVVVKILPPDTDGTLTFVVGDKKELFSLMGSGADRVVGAIRSGVRRADAAYAAMT